MFRSSIATLTFLSGTGAALADSLGSNGYGGHMWGGGFGTGYGIFGMGMMIVFWLVIIALVVVAIRWLSDGRSGGASGNAAAETLKQRLAKGEIDPEEYASRRKALEE